MYKNNEASEIELSSDEETEEILDQMLDAIQRGDSDEEDYEEERDGDSNRGSGRNTRILH
jgi:hypothetical protein